MSDLVEEPLDAVALPVELLADADWGFKIEILEWNFRPSVSIREPLAPRVAIVTLVAQKQGAFK